MASRSLDDSFDTFGEWHLPENPTESIAGNLTYASGKTELQLHGAFRPLQGTIRVNDNLQRYPLIYGTTREGEAMTLLNALRSGISINFGSGGFRQPERIITSWLLIGGHIPEGYVYPSMSFRIPGLQIWLSRPVIEQEFSKSQEHSLGWPWIYRVNNLPAETTRISSIEADLDWGISCSSNADPFTTISVTVAGWVTIKPDTPKAIEWYLEQQSKLSTLLAFLAGTPMAPDCIEAAVGDTHHTISVMVALGNAQYCAYNNLHEFFMLRGSIEVDLLDVLNNWFEKYPSVKMPSQLALSILASNQLWLHIEFLSLMQALEGFHRALYEGKYMPQAEYETVKKALGDAIPSGLSSAHKDALRSRIRYGNQISLRKRLDALVETLSDQIRINILGAKGEIPRKWIDTRNYYTHWDEELCTNVLDDQELYNANVRMRHLLRVLYLDLVGIPQTAILKSLYNASGVSQQLIQLNAIEQQGGTLGNGAGVILTISEQPTNAPEENISPDLNVEQSQDNGPEIPNQ